ncbi:replication initiation regulator SeqA [Alteromonas sp. RW2A1]|uniref:replication initiation regulator SeqA n=1 Tax=Alteromonas sp. RW2A1 TaxID=1917158 RepID=UPI00090434B3|nr:replication initiation regulator SeqA [Alteromonas sp. RW2A1]APE05552.1 replication initiation regulator SeqA [Alteromonas sp. RW2A1]
MKSIEIDDDLYAFIASQTKHIGESASKILRRLLLPEDGAALHSVKTPAASLANNTANSSVKNASASQSAEADKKVEVSTTQKQVPSATAISNTATEKATVTRQRKSTAGAAQDDASTSTSATSSSTSRAKQSPVKKAASAKAAVTSAAPVNENADSEASSAAQAHDKDDILTLVSKSALSTFTKRVDQFLFVLSAAHKLNADSFERVESIKGKNRTYFATSKEALLENGSSTNPKAIPDSSYWVVTNNNTAKKVSMLEQVLRQLGYSPEVIDSVISRFSSEGK